MTVLIEESRLNPIVAILLIVSARSQQKSRLQR
jgi:hypothetical protein